MRFGRGGEIYQKSKTPTICQSRGVDVLYQGGFKNFCHSLVGIQLQKFQLMELLKSRQYCINSVDQNRTRSCTCHAARGKVIGRNILAEIFTDKRKKGRTWKRMEDI